MHTKGDDICCIEALPANPRIENRSDCSPSVNFACCDLVSVAAPKLSSRNIQRLTLQQKQDNDQSLVVFPWPTTAKLTTIVDGSLVPFRTPTPIRLARSIRGSLAVSST